jgi:hypothetical protein
MGCFVDTVAVSGLVYHSLTVVGKLRSIARIIRRNLNKVSGSSRNARHLKEVIQLNKNRIINYTVLESVSNYQRVAVMGDG